MKRVRNQGRQGDILLTRVAALPGICAEIPATEGQVILAYGESSGHTHAMPATDTRLLDFQGRAYVEVTGLTAQPLFHQEHETLLLEPGIYSVQIQRQHFDGIPGWSGTHGSD